MASTLTGAVGVAGLSTLTGGFIAVASSTAVAAFNVTGVTTLTGNATMASTTVTALKAGQLGTQISNINFGYCTIPATALVASTTTQVNCASATGVTSSDLVFVTATSSLPSMVVIQSATSTTGAIQVRLFDTGIGTTTAGGIDVTSLNFIAIH
jgi:hypothetical protein